MDIEKEICNFYEIERDCLYSSSRHRCRTETEGLHFVWFMRHYEEGLSIGKLAKIYGKGERGIKHGIAKIKNYIQYEKEYKNIYSELISKIEK